MPKAAMKNHEKLWLYIFASPCGLGDDLHRPSHATSPLNYINFFVDNKFRDHSQKLVGGLMRTNHFLLSKKLGGPLLAALNIFRDPLLVSIKFDTLPNYLMATKKKFPGPGQSFNHLQNHLLLPLTSLLVEK